MPSNVCPHLNKDYRISVSPRIKELSTGIRRDGIELCSISRWHAMAMISPELGGLVGAELILNPPELTLFFPLC